MNSLSHMTLAFAIFTAACSSDSSDGAAPGQPLDPPLSGLHGQQNITLRYGFVQNLEQGGSFMGKEIGPSYYSVGAVLSDAPVNCSSDLAAMFDSQRGLYLGLLFGDEVNGEYISNELNLKFRSATRSRGLSTSGGSEFGRLGLPADGKYSASISVLYDQSDPDDLVSFIGNVALHDCDFQ